MERIRTKLFVCLLAWGALGWLQVPATDACPRGCSEVAREESGLQPDPEPVSRNSISGKSDGCCEHPSGRCCSRKNCCDESGCHSPSCGCCCSFSPGQGNPPWSQRTEIRTSPEKELGNRFLAASAVLAEGRNLGSSGPFPFFSRSKSFAVKTLPNPDGPSRRGRGESGAANAIGV